MSWYYAGGVETYTLQQSQGLTAAATANVGQDTTDDRWALGLSFVANANYDLSQVILLLQKQGTGGAGTYGVRLYGDSAFTVGSLVATSNTTIAGTALPASYADTSFLFNPGNRPSLVNGTRYWIIITSSAISGGNFCNVRYLSTGTGATEKVHFSTTAIASPTWQLVDDTAAGYLKLYKSP